MVKKRRVAAIILLCGLLIVLVAGCAWFGQEDGEAGATPATPVPTPTVTATPAVAPQPTREAGPMTLRVWMAPGIAPGDQTRAETLLTEQLAAFSTSHPDLELEVSIKSPTGQGGTLSYLRTGQVVAPGTLPDLVLLPADALVTAVSEQLVYPLDSWLTSEMLNDLYPAGRALGQVDGSVYGYPLTLSGLQHVAYASGRVFTDSIPLEWEELITTEAVAFAFAGAGSPGPELALQFYLSSGAVLQDEQGRFTLDVAAMTDALSAFQRGREQGAILVQSGSLTSIPETWTLLTRGQANAVQTSATHYLSQRPLPVNITYGPSPGPQGRLTPLVRATVLAISTPDVARQSLAAELLTWLASGENMGEWSSAAGLLPARRSAFEHWPQGDAYIDFLASELDQAGAFPSAAGSTFMNALGTAVFQVVSLGEPADAAAAALAAAIQP
jgi:ABC-type glycerol-3-phosphate transport system substrate-binding protein